MSKRRKTRLESESTRVKRTPKVRIVNPKGRPFQLRYDCPEQKRQVRISTATRDEREAVRLRDELQAKLTLGLPVSVRTEEIRGPQMLWQDFREQYRVLHLNSLREGSVIHTESRLDLAERILHPKKLEDVANPLALQKLQAELLSGAKSRRKGQRSPHTVRGHMNTVLAALNWAHLQQWLPQPVRIRKVKVSKMKAMKGRPISAEEFAVVLEAVATVVGEEAVDSWKYLLRGLWESALRLEELMHVSWDRPRTIRPQWKQGELPVLAIPAAMQKNDTEESIPLLPWFESLLLETPEDQRKGWVFNPQSLQSRLGRKVRHNRPSAEWVGKVIAKIGKQAGIVVEEPDAKSGRPVKYVTAHDLRRSCGERLREAGVPPLVICRVMRHSSWETTRRHYAPGDIQADAKVLRQVLTSGSQLEEKEGEDLPNDLPSRGKDPKSAG